MLIDLSYFTGALHIAGLDNPAVQEKVGRYIVQYETEYLERMLGYQLATSFIDGLTVDPILSIWTDLLLGATFYDVRGNLDKWKGFIQSSQNVSYSFNTSVKGFAWQVGSAKSPIAGQSSFYDSRLLNKQFIIERIGYGTLLKEGDEGVVNPDFSLSNGTVTLKGADTFTTNEKYYIHVLNVGSSIDYTGVSLSPIANYVYFYYMRDEAVMATRVGTKVSKAENATTVNPVEKQRYAWNMMVDMNRKLSCFLNANNVTYSYDMYRRGYYCNELLQKIMFYD